MYGFLVGEGPILHLASVQVFLEPAWDIPVICLGMVVVLVRPVSETAIREVIKPPFYLLPVQTLRFSESIDSISSCVLRQCHRLKMNTFW